MKEEINFTEDEKNLVITRLKAMPSDLRIITLGKSFSREDLIKQVETGTGLGARIAKRELNYVNTLWTREI